MKASGYCKGKRHENCQVFCGYIELAFSNTLGYGVQTLSCSLNKNFWHIDISFYSLQFGLAFFGEQVIEAIVKPYRWSLLGRIIFNLMFYQSHTPRNDFKIKFTSQMILNHKIIAP